MMDEYSKMLQKGRKTLIRLEWRPVVGDGTVWQLSLPFVDKYPNCPIATAVRFFHSDWQWIVHVPETKSQFYFFSDKPTNEEVLTLE